MEPGNEALKLSHVTVLPGGGTGGGVEDDRVGQVTSGHSTTGGHVTGGGQVGQVSGGGVGGHGQVSGGGVGGHVTTASVGVVVSGTSVAIESGENVTSLNQW